MCNCFHICVCDLVFRDVIFIRFYTFKCVNLFLCTEYSILFLLHEKLNHTHMNHTYYTLGFAVRLLLSAVSGSEAIEGLAATVG